MKSKSMVVVLPLTAVLSTGICRPNAWAAPKYSDWSEPVNLGSYVNSAFDDLGPAISKDGLSLYFGSNRPGGIGAVDIWVSQRSSVHDPWGPPVNLGQNINTPAVEVTPAFSRDGHWLFFTSTRLDGFGGFDIWCSYRVHTHDDFGWEPAVNLGPIVNSAGFEAGPSFLENDDQGIPLLFFSSIRPGGLGMPDIYVSELGEDGLFGPASVVWELSSEYVDIRPTVRFDGLEVLIEADRIGSLGPSDLWVSTRESVWDDWSLPVNLGPIVNSEFWERQPYLASDRLTLFFTSDRTGGQGGFDLYVTTRTNASPE